MVQYLWIGAFRFLLAILGTFLSVGAVPQEFKQQKFNLEVEVAGQSNEDKVYRQVSSTYNKVSSQEAAEIERESLFELFSKGYLEASTILRDTMGDDIKIVVNPGIKYHWTAFEVKTDQLDMLRKAGIREGMFNGRPVSPKQVTKAMRGILSYLENNGYPFAAVSLDSIGFNNGNTTASLKIDKGPMVQINSIRIYGDAKIRKAYITNYISVKEGDLYDESRVREISARLSELPFVSMTRPPEVVFTEDTTKLSLFLNKEKASRFSGIAGFQPDEVTGKITITGDVSINLLNTLGQGEELNVNWRKLQSNTQDLQSNAVLPFLLNSPFGVDATLNIYRRDTLFTDVFRQLGLRYLLSGGNFLRLFVERQTSSLITTDQYADNILPPPYLDRAITSYGLGTRYSKLDYRPSPSRGIELNMEGAAGNKQILINPRLPEVIYSGMELSSLQIRAFVKGGAYFSPVKRFVIYEGIQGASLYNRNLFNNELFRIGGLKTIRGFDEESIFASSYLVSKTELRYILERNSYFFLFFDGAWYENLAVNRVGAGQDTPFGFGAGITFSTNAGIFSINYALGSQQGNPVLIRAAKIHFGFLSLF